MGNVSLSSCRLLSSVLCVFMVEGVCKCCSEWCVVSNPPALCNLSVHTVVKLYTWEFLLYF